MSGTQHAHDGAHSTHASKRVDPTQTTTIRREYSGKCYKRYRRVKGQIRKVVTSDADPLGLRSGQANVAPRYDFPQDDGKKVKEFTAWVEQALADEVLEKPNGSRWTDKYVRSAYGRGLDHATQALQQQGVDVDEVNVEDVFNIPIHRSTLRMLYTRQFEALRGINAAVSKEISRVLTAALAEGVNPREAARRLNDRVDAVGITRARTMARTETIRAHAWATLDRYERVMGGDASVTIKAEWEAAEDDRVCDECEELDGNVYSLEKARSLIPAHPNCRCAILPITRH